MSSAPEVTPAPGRRRWHLPLGLRPLLFVLMLMLILLSLVAIQGRKVLRQRHVVDKIKSSSGYVKYDYEFGLGADLSPTWELDNPWMEPQFENGKRSRSRVDAFGNTIEELESPPGPKLLRYLFGDDVFANIELVNTSPSLEFGPSSKLDPGILLELPQLKVVILRNRFVTDEWLSTVAQIPKLHSLSLMGGDLSTATPQGFAKLKAATQLKSLSMSGKWVTDEVVDETAALTSLQALSLLNTPNVHQDFFSRVKDLTELRVLDIYDARYIDDRGAEHLAGLTNLRYLSLWATAISDTTLSHLSSLRELEQLNLMQTKLTNEGVQHLVNLSKLRSLDLSTTAVSDAGLESLAKLSRLERLNLGGSAITDAGIPILAKMRQLQFLDLYWAKVHDQGALRLIAHPEFQHLRLGPYITPQAAKQITERWKQPENLELLDKEGSRLFPN